MSGLAARRLIKRSLAGVDAVLPPREPPHRILAYHSVGAGARLELDLGTDTFEQQLSILAARYRVVPLADAVAGVEDDGAPAVVLTFDDAYESFRSVVLPLLRDHGFPATLYVPTWYVDTGSRFPWCRDAGAERPSLLRPMTWDELAEVSADPLVTIGNHTHTHRTLPSLSPAEVVEELDVATSVFESRLGVSPEDFCYPEGRYSEADHAVVRSRFRSAVVGRRGSGVTEDVWRLRRMVPMRSDPPGQFERMLNGADRAYRWAMAAAGRA